MKKFIFVLVLAITGSVWTMSKAQCLVPSTEQEGPYIKDLTGILDWDSYPCPYNEVCPPCLTVVLRTKEKKYYLTGSVVESFNLPANGQYVKVVVSGIAGNNDLYDWLKVYELLYSEEPITTNIQTHGYVEDEIGTELEGIRVIVHTADWTTSDTVYTNKGGEFVSTIKGIAYPVGSMQVTVSDVSRRYKEQTLSTTSTYECGVDFNPETDTGFNSEKILFVLQENVSVPSDTIPLYVKDGPGSSTVEPVDPNQITATLRSNLLTVSAFMNKEITYLLTHVVEPNKMQARNTEEQPQTFVDSVSIQLTESGTYTLQLTNPEWDYTIIGSFDYISDYQSIKQTSSSTSSIQKILRNGQLLILRDDRIYTITGMQIR